MRSLVDRLLKSLREFFGRLSKGQRVRLGLLSAAVVVLAIIVVSLMGRTKYGVLFYNLEPGKAGEIQSALLEMGVTPQVEGTTIKVPENMISELQNTLTAAGYMSDSLTPDILASASGFGITDSVQKQYSELQLSSWIDKQISQLNKIQKSTTLVHLGEDSPFVMSQSNSEATASVVLAVKGGVALTNAEANMIADMVRGAVPGIKLENISIKDTNLNPYTIGDSAGDIGNDVNAHFTLQNQLRQQWQNQIEQLLTPIFGTGNLKISGSVTLNFDNIVSESVVYEPPIAGEMDGIVRSASELYESQRADGTASGVVGTDPNGMGTGATEYPFGTLADEEQYNKTLLETNYEINETRTRIEQAQGTIKEASISVLINSETASGDYTTQVKSLVSKALGLNEEYIAVEMLPLQDTSQELQDLLDAQEAEAKQQQLRAILETVIKWGVVLLLGLSFLSLLRMIIKNVGESKSASVAVAGVGIDYLAGENDARLNYEDVDLNAKPEGVEQLEKFIDRDSRAVAQLLRNWLSDE